MPRAAASPQSWRTSSEETSFLGDPASSPEDRSSCRSRKGGGDGDGGDDDGGDDDWDGVKGYGDCDEDDGDIDDGNYCGDI